MAGASEFSASGVPSKEWRFSLLEEARTSRAPPQETRPEMTQGEKHMKRRKNQFREALDAKREALTRAANQPKPEPEWEPETPELRAEVLADRLEEREAEFAKEQERRRAAERKVQEFSNPRRTLGDLIHTNRRRKRAPWK